MSMAQEEMEKYHDWYFKCPAGRDGIPFVAYVLDFAQMEVKHPENYTKEELNGVVEDAYERYEREHGKYTTLRDFIISSLAWAMMSRNPKMYAWASWFFQKESFDHNSKWYDDKTFKMAEAVCVHGMDDYQSIHNYMHSK